MGATEEHRKKLGEPQKAKPVIFQPDPVVEHALIMSLESAHKNWWHYQMRKIEYLKTHG